MVAKNTNNTPRNKSTPNSEESPMLGKRLLMTNQTSPISPNKTPTCRFTLLFVT